MQPDSDARQAPGGELHHQPCRRRTCALPPTSAPCAGRSAAPFHWELPITNAGGLSVAQRARGADAAGARSRSTTPASVGGSCTSGGGAIECQLGDMPGGNVRTIELELSSDVAGSHAIVAHVTADHDSESHRQRRLRARSSSKRRRTYRSRCAGPRPRRRNERFTVDFDVTQRRRGQCGNGHGEDRHPGRHHGRQRIADERHVVRAPRRASSARWRRSAADRRRAARVSLTASAAGSAALHASVSGSYFDTNNANDTADLVVAVSGAATLASQSAAAGCVRRRRVAAARSACCCSWRWHPCIAPAAGALESPLDCRHVALACLRLPQA